MTTTRTDDDKARVLKDGEKLTVRMTMMDAAHLTDLTAGDAVLHRPGYLPVKVAAADEARAKLYDARDARVADAWRNPPPIIDQQQQEKKPTPPASGADPYAARDKRLEDAWRS